MRVIRIYRWRCTDRAIEPLARHDVRCAKGPSLLAISLIYSGICWQGKNADTPFATVNPESQASAPDRVRECCKSPFEPRDVAVKGSRDSNRDGRRQRAHRPPTAHRVLHPRVAWRPCRNTRGLLGGSHSLAAPASQSAAVPLDSRGWPGPRLRFRAFAGHQSFVRASPRAFRSWLGSPKGTRRRRSRRGVSRFASRPRLLGCYGNCLGNGSSYRSGIADTQLFRAYLSESGLRAESRREGNGFPSTISVRNAETVGRFHRRTDDASCGPARHAGFGHRGSAAHGGLLYHPRLSDCRQSTTAGGNGRHR